MRPRQSSREREKEREKRASEAIRSILGFQLGLSEWMAARDGLFFPLLPFPTFESFYPRARDHRDDQIDLSYTARVHISRADFDALPSASRIAQAGTTRCVAEARCISFFLSLSSSLASSLDVNKIYVIPPLHGDRGKTSKIDDDDLEKKNINREKLRVGRPYFSSYTMRGKF